MTENVSHDAHPDCIENTHIHSQSFIGGKNPFEEQISLREIKSDLRIRGTSEIVLVIATKPQWGKRMVVRGYGSP